MTLGRFWSLREWRGTGGRFCLTEKIRQVPQKLFVDSPLICKTLARYLDGPKTEIVNIYIEDRGAKGHHTPFPRHILFSSLWKI